jgi:DNA-binding GntR family transcriptional regulator
MSDSDFLSLNILHKKLDSCFARHNQKENIRNDNAYHTFLQELAGNRNLNQIITGLRQKILPYRFQSLNLPERFDQSTREHRQLLEAFRKRNPEKAEELLRLHLKRRCKSLEEIVK